MGFKTKRCEATSKSTGKRCRQPAVKGFDTCRFHMEKKLDDEDEAEDQKRKNNEEAKPRGGQSGNKNAVKHGAYSLNLLPAQPARKRGRNLGKRNQRVKMQVADNTGSTR